MGKERSLAIPTQVHGIIVELLNIAVQKKMLECPVSVLCHHLTTNVVTWNIRKMLTHKPFLDFHCLWPWNCTNCLICTCFTCRRGMMRAEWDKWDDMPPSPAGTLKKRNSRLQSRDTPRVSLLTNIEMICLKMWLNFSPQPGNDHLCHMWPLLTTTAECISAPVGLCSLTLCHLCR